ncbi:MAG: formylmethanofuran--tetrahydromethanopterin N-formyltransferase [Deltaproteobacteria bacterium]
MHLNGVEIEDTFAEAFGMWGSRLIVTAETLEWARTAAAAATGFATSIIGCGCEAGVNELGPDEETPDGRPGIAVLVFATSRSNMESVLLARVGQAIMTSATSACYDGLGGGERLKVGGKLRYFGDGFQRSKLLDGRRLWRVPVMDGEFVVEESFGVAKGVGGGNFFMMGENLEAALTAAEAAVAAMRSVPGAIMPFPGGVVRSGSKVSSRYKGQNVSSNTPYCPTLRAQEQTALREGENAVLEIVIDGLDEQAVREAMRVGITAACLPGVTRISAGNYGGSLGQFHFALRELVTA